MQILSVLLLIALLSITTVSNAEEAIEITVGNTYYLIGDKRYDSSFSEALDQHFDGEIPLLIVDGNVSEEKITALHSEAQKLGIRLVFAMKAKEQKEGLAALIALVRENLYGLLFGIFVAVFTWSVPKILEWWHVKQKSRELVGTWLSEYQSIDKPDYFYKEKLDIQVSFLKERLQIKNSDIKEGYFYEALCIIEDKNFISGSWTSTNKGASASGSISLIVSPHGNFMYGYWSGSNSEGGKNFGKWAIGREQKDIETARSLLTTGTSEPQPQA